jgi:outer membrane protein
MKYVVRGLLALALLPLFVVLPSVAVAQQTAAPAKVAFVNMQKVLSEMPGYAQAESTFAKEVASYRTEFQQLQSKLDSAAAAFQSQSTLLSPAARQAKRDELQQQQGQMEQRGNELQQKMVQRQQELLGPMQDRAVAVVEKLRQAGGYAMVFDVSNQSSAIITADRSLDLSDKAIAELKTPGQ